MGTPLISSREIISVWDPIYSLIVPAATLHFFPEIRTDDVTLSLLFRPEVLRSLACFPHHQPAFHEV